MFFGITALVFVGLTWTFIGIVMSSAPRHGLKTGLVQLAGAALAILFSLGVLPFLPGSHVPDGEELLFCGLLVLAGGLNGAGLEWMAQAMKHGPNGLIWALVQSALIVPFLAGVVFFGSELNGTRIAGIVLLVAGILVLGWRQDRRHPAAGRWRGPTFLAFIASGIVLTLNNLPSYFRVAEEISSVMRTLCVYLGTLIAATAISVADIGWNELARVCRSHFASRRFNVYVLTLQGFGLGTGYFLIYPAMDALARAGSGAIACPLMIGSCIIGFNFYSMFVLREKWSAGAFAATLICIAGAALTCW